MRIALAAACAGTLVAFAAQAQESALTAGGAFHYSSGDYGTGSETRITSFAATGRYERGPWVYKATVPWLTISGSSTVVPGFGDVRGGASGPRKSSGLGDIVLSATYSAYYDRASTLGVELTGKLKLPTADEEDGLGTGEHDVVFLLDLYRSFGRVTGFGGIGFHVLGDSRAFPLENAWSANLGASYQLDERNSVGAVLDGRERVVAGGPPLRELTAFWMYKFETPWRAQAYYLIGLADGSPDRGFGLALARPL